MFLTVMVGSKYECFAKVAQLIDLLGSWKWTGKYDIPAISLETSEHNLSGENKHRFLDFVRSILRWLPEERKSATELLKDPWLNSVIT